MPSGTTLEDLLSWLAILLEDTFSTKSSVSRRHARDIAVAEEANNARWVVPGQGF